MTVRWLSACPKVLSSKGGVGRLFPFPFLGCRGIVQVLVHADGIGVNVFDSNDPGQRWQINWTAELQVQHSALGLQVASCPRIPWRHAAPRTATAHRHSSPTPTHPHTHTPTQHPHPHPHPHTARSTQHTAHRTPHTHTSHRPMPPHGTALSSLCAVCCVRCGWGCGCVLCGCGACCVGVLCGIVFFVSIQPHADWCLHLRCSRAGFKKNQNFRTGSGTRSRPTSTRTTGAKMD